LRRTCLELAIRHTEQEPDSRVLLIVPEQTKMDMEQDYLTMSRAPGLMQAEVLSFRRLAWRLLGEVGRQPLFPVDPVGRAMLIHRVLHQNKDLLHSFGYLADKPGFIRQVTAVLGDLKRYRIGAKQLQAAAEKAEEKALKDKSLDLAIVLGGYDAALAEAGLTDAEDDLTRLAELLQTLSDLPGSDWPWPWSRLSWLRQTHVLVSGFGEVRDFTPQESVVLRGLAALCAHMTLTAAADTAPGDSQVLDQGLEAFMAGRRTIWHLQAVLPGLEIRRVDAEMTGLQARIARLLRYGSLDREPVTQDGCQLRLIRAPSTDDELSYLAGMIRQLVQLEGYRYRDISVALCSLPSYLPRLRAIFREYGLPLFLDMERPLNGSPLMRHVLGLLDIGLTNWSRQALMGYLRAGLSGLTAADIDRLETPGWPAAFSAGTGSFAMRFTGCRGWPLKQKQRRRAQIPTKPDPNARRRIAACWPCETRRCSGPGRAAPVIRPIGRAGQGRCAAPDPCRQRDARAGRRPDRPLGRSAGNGRCCHAGPVLECASTRSGPACPADARLAVSLKQFRDSVSAGLDTAAAGVIPSAIDQVGIGDLQRSMLRRAKVLFVVGASAQNLPPALPPEGLLKDPDRQRIAQLIGSTCPAAHATKFSPIPL
jgi:ATP-dependent helicase/nuclease subunit B